MPWLLLSIWRHEVVQQNCPSVWKFARWFLKFLAVASFRRLASLLRPVEWYKKLVDKFLFKFNLCTISYQIQNILSTTFLSFRECVYNRSYRTQLRNQGNPLTPKITFSSINKKLFIKILVSRLKTYSGIFPTYFTKNQVAIYKSFREKRGQTDRLWLL